MFSELELLGAALSRFLKQDLLIDKRASLLMLFCTPCVSFQEDAKKYIGSSLRLEVLKM
jgi:hypothetical protein